MFHLYIMFLTLNIYNISQSRNVSELVRRIDSVHQSAVKVRDVFSEEGLDLRVRLRDYCFKLLHTDPGSVNC